MQPLFNAVNVHINLTVSIMYKYHLLGIIMASAAISSLSLSLQYSPAESSTCRAVVVGEPLVYQFIKGEFLPGSDKKVDSQSGSWSMNNHYNHK